MMPKPKESVKIYLCIQERQMMLSENNAIMHTEAERIWTDIQTTYDTE